MEVDLSLLHNAVRIRLRSGRFERRDIVLARASPSKIRAGANFRERIKTFGPLLLHIDWGRVQQLGVSRSRAPRDGR